MLNVTSPEPNVRNDPALSSAENIPQTDYKHNAALVKQFGGKIVNGKPVFDNARDEADYQRYVEAERRGEVKLSVSGNASSTVTNLTTKIKTAFTTVKNERTHNHMRKLLEEVSGYRIRTGRFAKGVGNAPVDDVAKVIRTSAAYDWDTIVPAASKLVAEKLKLNPSPEMTDYVTRWFVDGAANDNSTEAQDFQQAMRQADDYYRNKLFEVRELFDAWNKRAPEEIVRDSIAHGKPEKPLTDEAKGFFDGAYEQFVEELYPVKQLVDAFEEELHRKLTDEENPYVLLRNYRGMAGRAKIMVEEGAAAIEALKAALPDVNFDKNNFKTIRMILESCDALNNEERRKQFSDYLLACSVKDLHNLNNANLQAQAQLKRLIEQLEDAMDATPFSEKVCDATIAKVVNNLAPLQMS